MGKVVEYKVEREYTLVRHILKSTFSAKQISAIKKRGRVEGENGRLKADDKVFFGAVVKIYLPDEENPSVPQKTAISVVYEDEDLLVVDKDSGVCSTPTGKANVLGGLKYLYPEQNFHVLTRLDKDTKGLVLLAKSAYATERMRAVPVEKRYLAVVEGKLGKTVVDKPIRRGEGIRREIGGDKRAITEVTPVSFDEASGQTLVECVLHTGRTHQIRVHLSSIGHPVAGDGLYGRNASGYNGGQRLVCNRLAFISPFSQKHIVVTSGFLP